MCGRFLEFSPIGDLISEFELIVDGNYRHLPSYNVAPSQPVLSVVREEGRNTLKEFRWGLIPSWAKDRSIGYKMINARAETVAEKPSFRSAFVKRRCLILADGFYEWKKEDKSKRPHFIYLTSKRPFGMGGLYERWVSSEGEVIDSCTIITTAANRMMLPLHDRMPLILPKEHEALWLDPEVQDKAALDAIMQPYPAEEMDAYPVSPAVNSPRHNSPDNILRVA